MMLSGLKLCGVGGAVLFVVVFSLLFELTVVFFVIVVLSTEVSSIGDIA